MNIAFLGIGKMGLPMAGHLKAAGYDVGVFDVSASQLAQAQTAAMTPFHSVQTAVQGREVIFSSLANDEIFESVALQIAEFAQPGTIYVDTSTVSIAASARVAHIMQKAALRYLRVTVSGNNKMAEAAQLTAMASGERACFEAVLPLLKCLGPTQFYLGAAEQARLMKLVVNLMIAVNVGMLGEALALGQKGGLDWKDMWSVLATSAVGSPILKAKSEQLRHHDYTPTFTVNQMLKDVGLILDAAAQLHVPLSLTSQVNQMLHATVAMGAESLDYSAIIQSIQAAAGVPTQP